MKAGDEIDSPGKSTSRAESQEDDSYSSQLLKTLPQREKLFRIIFEKAGIGIGITDHRGNFIDVNPAMANIIGYSRAQLLKMNFIQITHPEDVDKSKSFFAELSAGKRESYWLEKRYVKRDGRTIWIHLTVSCQRTEEGLPEFCISMVEDVTERKAVLEALRKSEERYRLLAENISDVIWTKDLSGKITYISPSFEKLTGINSVEAIGMKLNRYTTPASTELFLTNVTKQLKLEKSGSQDPSRSWTIEIEMLHHDASTFWAEWKMTFLRNPQGIPIGMVGVTRDISKRKLLEKQLIPAQKMEAVARLAGGVAHDFNNFLMAIMGYSEIIMKILPLDDPLQRYAQDILMAAERTSAVTRQLLAFSRRQVLQPQILNLNGLISEIERMLRRLIPENIELEVGMEPDLGNIKADPGQIEQVIMNLVVNSKDALPRGGKILIQTERIYLDAAYAQEHPDAKPGFYIKLTVADNGAGMDAKTLNHLFEPFFSSKKGEQGTGLGLATVYGIIKQSGGHIEVCSEVGQGTTFSIYLPRVFRAEVPKEIVASLAGLQGNETILVAEDEQILREVICKSLQAYGFKVLEAADGRKALRIAEEYAGPIHLLLADVVMPHMGGTELASRLAKLRPEIKILYMSGHVENALTRHGLLKKAAPFIQKPCRTISLVRKVHEVLHPAKAA